MEQLKAEVESGQLQQTKESKEIVRLHEVIETVETRLMKQEPEIRASMEV
jgi:hypothetical protein